jgi:uncharacterized membrane protein
MDLRQKLLFIGFLLFASQISFIRSNEEEGELETDSYKKNAKIGRKFYLCFCVFVCWFVGLILWLCICLFACLLSVVFVHMFVCLFVVCMFVLLVSLFVCIFVSFSFCLFVYVFVFY